MNKSIWTALVASAIAVAAHGFARADFVPVATGGQWTALADTVSPVKNCSVQAAIGGGRFTLFGASDRGGVLRLNLYKSSWQIKGINVPIELSFPGGVTFNFLGVGTQSIISAEIPTAEVKSFLHQFTADASATMTLPEGREPPWQLDLTGTTPTIAAMARCLETAEIWLPLPFAQQPTSTLPLSGAAQAPPVVATIAPTVPADRPIIQPSPPADIEPVPEGQVPVQDHAFVQPSSPTTAPSGFKAENVQRAKAMDFETERYAMAYPANASGQPFAETVQLPDQTKMKFIRLDSPWAVMMVVTSVQQGRLIWMTPDDVENAAGWTLAKVLSGEDESKTTTAKGLMAGGPFVLRGSNMIACKRADAVQALSAPGAEERFGPHNIIILFEQYGCMDIPDGVLVDVLAAGEHVAMIVPRLPVSTMYYVLRSTVMDSNNSPIPTFKPYQ
jgi:hypothetical protein